ncbi:MAG: TetR/AcrR family transcriptional regulator [Alphaproteobacteria bacterium]
MARRADLADRALEAALAAAETVGWDAVRLTDVAETMGVPASDVLDHYRDKDALADAWFRRGLRALLADKPDDFADLPPAERIETCLMAWFDAMAAHREVTVQMLRGKLNPGHPHHWVPMAFNLSRLIQWLREAARLPAVYGTRRAQFEEIGLTGLFLATLAVWARDDSDGQARTGEVLRRRLDRADRLLQRLDP